MREAPATTRSAPELLPVAVGEAEPVPEADELVDEPDEEDPVWTAGVPAPEAVELPEVGVTTAGAAPPELVSTEADSEAEAEAEDEPVGEGAPVGLAARAAHWDFWAARRISMSAGSHAVAPQPAS